MRPRSETWKAKPPALTEFKCDWRALLSDHANDVRRHNLPAPEVASDLKTVGSKLNSAAETVSQAQCECHHEPSETERRPEFIWLTPEEKQTRDADAQTSQDSADHPER